MISISRWSFVLLLVGNVTAGICSAADFDSATVMYGHGVQAFFSGNQTRAEMYLRRASELSSSDPRPYYFLGLALTRQGRSWEADEAMRTGAALEARSDTSAYGVGQALERVQGGDRLRLEQIRHAARLNAAGSAAENARRRYEQLDRRQAQVQRTQFRLPFEALANPVQPGRIADVVAAAQSAAARPPVEATASPAEEVVVAEEQGDPFVDDPPMEGTTNASVEVVNEVEADVPNAARGAVKASSLPGIFGRMIGSQLPSVDVQGLRERVPGLGSGAMPSTGEPGGLRNPADSGDIGEQFPAPDENPFEMQEPVPEEGSPAVDEPQMRPSDDENPFDS